MNAFKIALSILIYICIVFGAMSSIGIDHFLDFPSAVFVLGISISSMLCNSGKSYEAVQAFSKGAVLGGWLGAIIGLISITANSGFDKPSLISPWINNGPALSAMLTIVLYGYIIKGLCFIIVSTLRRDD